MLGCLFVVAGRRQDKECFLIIPLAFPWTSGVSTSCKLYANAENLGFNLWAATLTDLSKAWGPVENLLKAIIVVHMSISFLAVTETESEIVLHKGFKVTVSGSGSGDCHHSP